MNRKLLAVVMIMAGSLGTAFCYSRELTERKRVYRQLWELLEFVESEVRYGKSTLQECFLLAGKQKQGRTAYFFSQTGLRMAASPGADFKEVLQEEAELMLGSFLQREDLEELMLIAGTEGYHDRQMQLRALERSRERIHKTGERLELEYRDKCRMAWTFAGFGGFFLILLLI